MDRFPNSPEERDKTPVVPHNDLNVKNNPSIRISSLFVGLLAAAGAFAQTGEFYSHGDPTPYEQIMLEWVNAARANPTAEMQRLGIGLNDGLPAGTITATPKQPLAFNPQIIAAARAHSAWMLANNTFSHTGVDGTRAIHRMADAGYPFVAPYLWGENISWRGSTGSIDLVATTRQNHDGLMRSPSHRVNLMADRAEEAGFGILQGKFVSGHSFNANMVTQNFAMSAGSPVPDVPFVVGVVYRDLNKNGAYDVGEGLSGVTITTSVGRHYTVTSSSGGYAVPVAGGESSTIVVVARAEGATPNERTVAWDGRTNLKVDFVFATEATIPVEIAADSDLDGIEDGMDLVDSSAPKTPIHANTRWEWTVSPTLTGVSRFQATGLPPGLKFNPAKGILSGAPSKPGIYTIKVRALHGKTWGQWQEIRLEVRAWPAHATGGFVALLGRESSLNQSLGGMLQATTTSLGQMTGSLRLGTRILPFRSQLSGDPGETPTATVTLPRRGATPLVLSLSWDEEIGFTGQLTDGTRATSLAGWKKTWDARTNAAPVELRGQFNAVLPLVSNEADPRPVPQGSGWTILRIDAAGVATFLGKTAEGARFTSALPIGPEGEIALWTLPVNNPSSLMGQAEISENHLDGSLGWVKLPQAGRSWPQGFGIAEEPVQLSILGARYSAPAPGTAHLAWGLPAAYPNALVATADGIAFSFAVNPNGSVAVARPGTAGNTNFARIGISLRDGLITGSRVISDIDPNNPAKKLNRTATFETIIVSRDTVSTGAFACGFQLAAAAPIAGQNPKMTLMVSESACLFPNTL